MKIGIIVHSFTGHTYSVAEKVQASLLQAGHSAEIERITVQGGEQPSDKQFMIENAPEAGKYDALIFGAPVRAFSISPVIAAYLEQLSSLNGKKVACFVTKHLNTTWTGGNRAISGMKSICESKGGVVAGTGIILWTSKNRDSDIDALAAKLGVLF
jgi:NAD(P)H dehydrogenase (quinone)